MASGSSRGAIRNVEINELVSQGRLKDWVDAYEGKASEEVRAARLAMALKLFDETNTFEAAKK